MRKLILLGAVAMLLSSSSFSQTYFRRVTIQKSTGRMLEAQGTNSQAGTLRDNAISSGYAAVDIEEKLVTESEYKSLRSSLDDSIKPTIPTLATNATSGFLPIPVTYGAPTSTPDTRNDQAPVAYDKKNKRLYVYDGGWHYLQLTN